MHRMTDDEALAFIAARPRTGKLATVRPDGSPHVVPIWVAVDGHSLVATLSGDSAKVRALRRNPRVSICFDDERPPFSFVTAEGAVTLSEDLDELRRWAAVIGGRYMGEDRAEAYGARNGVPGEVLMRLVPDRIVGLAGVAD